MAMCARVHVGVRMFVCLCVCACVCVRVCCYAFACVYGRVSYHMAVHSDLRASTLMLITNAEVTV